MANYIYDEDTDTLYVCGDNGYGGLVLLFFLAFPFFIIAMIAGKYAVFVSEHKVLSGIIFVGLSILLGRLLYRNKRAKHRVAGIAAVVVSVLPIGLTQMFHAIPYILGDNDAISVAFEWMVVTFFTVGISFFVIQIGLLFKNGLKHLIPAAVYLLLTALLVF